MKKEIWINRSDLKKMLEVLERFEVGDENVGVLQISDGIGFTTEVQLDYTIHGIFCSVTVPIRTHEDW
jgi:hypothetical protein